MKRWSFYIFYSIAAFIFFLYYLFPSDVARDFIVSYLSEKQPDVGLSVNRIKPVFPPGVRLRAVDLSYKNEGLLVLDQFTIRPRYLTLFSDKKSFNFKSDAYQGDISGRLDLLKDTGALDIRIDADLQDIRLEDIRRLQEISGRKILGNLDADMAYQNSKGVNQQIDIRLKLSDCAVEIANPLINIDLKELTFRTIDAVVAVDSNTLELKQCKAVGIETDGDLSGTIRFRRPFAKSLLDFRGSLKLHHNLLMNMKDMLPANLLSPRKGENGELPIKLYGTIEKPKISFR